MNDAAFGVITIGVSVVSFELRRRALFDAAVRARRSRCAGLIGALLSFACSAASTGSGGTNGGGGGGDRRRSRAKERNRAHYFSYLFKFAVSICEHRRADECFFYVSRLARCLAPLVPSKMLVNVSCRKRSTNWK